MANDVRRSKPHIRQRKPAAALSDDLLWKQCCKLQTSEGHLPRRAECHRARSFIIWNGETHVCRPLHTALQLRMKPFRACKMYAARVSIKNAGSVILPRRMPRRSFERVVRQSSVRDLSKAERGSKRLKANDPRKQFAARMLAGGEASARHELPPMHSNSKNTAEPRNRKQHGLQTVALQN